MRKALPYIFIICLLFQPGCWDMREINELGLVMAVGIDKSPNNPNNFLVTVQIANPKSSSSAGEANKTQQKVWIASAEGKTIFEAIRNLATFSSQRIMWAHNNVIIIGESLAEDDISPVIDFFTHNYELRMKTWIAVGQGRASDFLATSVGMGDTPGQSATDLFRYQTLTGLGLQSSLLTVFGDFTSENMDPVLSLLSFNQSVIQPDHTRIGQTTQEQIQVSGGAVIKKAKVAGYLSSEECKGLAWVLSNSPNTVVSVPEPESNTKFAAIEIRDVKADIKSQLDDQDIPSFTIKISGKGSISEEDAFSDLSINELKSRLEASVDEQIVREIEMSLSKVQTQYKSDVLGLGRVVHVQHKKQWNEKISQQWEALYPQVEVIVQAHIEIQSSTLNQTPFRDYKKKGTTYDQSQNQ